MTGVLLAGESVKLFNIAKKVVWKEPSYESPGLSTGKTRKGVSRSPAFITRLLVMLCL